MNLEQIDNAIAKALGWTKHIHAEPESEAEERLDCMMGLYAGMPVWRNPEGKFVRDSPPKYSSDLNAMRDVLESLDDGQIARYVDQLSSIIDFSLFEDWTNHDAFAFSQATAAQQAEAYLETLGLWEEDNSCQQ